MLKRIGPWCVLVVLVVTGCTAPPHAADDPRSASVVVASSASFPHAAVACDHPLASQAGAAMLRQGGNAVDAAVAASFTLSVVRPYSCGIGGGGFMVIVTPPVGPGEAPDFITLNYRETCPAGVGPDYYLNPALPEAAGQYGVHAAGVPGTVAGLLHALEHYGTLDRAAVLAPAIRAAEHGFPADAHWSGVAEILREMLDDHPEMRGPAAYFWEHLCRSGELAVGDVITNPRQVRALQLIAEHGAEAFYRGEIADAITRVMRDHGGPITAKDLAAYQLREEQPLHGHFDRYEIITMLPPSSGGVAILQMLGILEFLGTDDFDHNTPEYVHLVTEAMKHAFADRAEWLADSHFVNVPVEQLLDPVYLDELTARINPGRTLDDPAAYGSRRQLPEDGGTSHISIIDKHGMAVACTETINTEFGSLVEVPGFGFALNNEMDDFTTIPGESNAYGLTQSDRNLPAPGKRPLSSMTPTIVIRNGRPVFVVGGSGGPRIINGTLQVLLNGLMFDMDAGAAVQAARFHHQWMPDTLYFDDRWPDEAVMDALRDRGHTVDRRADVGVIQFIRVTEAGIEAASDPRKGGAPAGM